MEILLIIAYVIISLCLIAGVTLTVSSGVKWHREDTISAHTPDYNHIRALEREIYGQEFTTTENACVCSNCKYIPNDYKQSTAPNDITVNDGYVADYYAYGYPTHYKQSLEVNDTYGITDPNYD